MKLITVSGPPSSGKTSVILKTIECLSRENIKIGIIKFDCLSTYDDLLYKKAGLPVKVGLSANLCPDHFYISNIEECTKWGQSKKLDILIKELKQPTLGICLGLQLMCSNSEEGNIDCLGIFPEKVLRFEPKLKVPHMGWNTLDKIKESLLFEEIHKEDLFYFVHSYHVNCNNPEDILATTIYGYEFVSAVQKGNIYGTQFHPEKSHGPGERMLGNFLRL